MKQWMMVVILIFGLIGPEFSALGAPFRLMGYESYAAGQANSQGAFGGGLGVLYSNPALLIDLDPQVEFGLLVLQPAIKATLMERPAHADVPITLYDSDVGIEGSNLDRPLPTSELPNARSNNIQDGLTGYLSMGLVHSLGLDDFRFGLALLVPTSGFASIKNHYPDEREQYFSNTAHFVRFGEWSQLLSVLLGAAYRPRTWLSIGLSMEASIQAGATMAAFVPEARVQDYALSTLALEGDISARAILGVTVRPTNLLSFSFMWRDRRYTKIKADAKLNLWNFHEPGDNTVPKRITQQHVLALDFEPMELGLSAGIQLGTISVEAGVTWNRWADYLDNHHKRPQESAIYEDPNQPGILKGDPDRFAFSNTVSVSLGSTWQYRPGHTLVAGAAYRPTPVPAQVGRTNYVDSDLLSVTIGHRFDFMLGQKSVRADVGLQFWHMFPVTVHKDPSLIRDEFADRAKTLIGGQSMPEAQGLQTNNPGFPGFRFGGWALVGSASLSYLF